MLSIFIKILAISIIPIVTIFLAKELFNYEGKIITLKNIFTLILLISIDYWLFAKDYSFITTIVLYIMLILVNRIIFDKNLFKVIIITTISMIVIGAADMLCSVVLINFVNTEMVRENSYVMLLSNLIVGIIALLLIKIRFVKRILSKFIAKFDNKKQNNTVLFLILLLILLSIFIYIISNNYRFTVEYWVAVCAIIIFFTLMFIFLTENNKYMQLKDNYKMLFDYFKELEEWIENERLTIHEHKNQLATIKNMTKNSKINGYIDEILKLQINLDDGWIDALKYIPKGGLKGLTYYKLINASQHKLSITVDINKNVTNLIKKIDLKNLRDLTQIIGIYFDNAIEAAALTKEKKISLEIYICKGELEIVICNSIDNSITLNKIDDKNYSTKGKNRGNGLYYASKILADNKIISSEKAIINNYFIQKIKIKNELM